MNSKTFNIGYIIIALTLFFAIQAWLGYRDTVQLSYTDVMQMVSDGRIHSVILTETMIEGQFKTPQDGKTTFIATRVDPATAELFQKTLDLAGGLFVLLLAPAFFDPLRKLSAVWHDKAAGLAAISALERLSKREGKPVSQRWIRTRTAPSAKLSSWTQHKLTTRLPMRTRMVMSALGNIAATAGFERRMRNLDRANRPGDEKSIAPARFQLTLRKPIG